VADIGIKKVRIPKSDFPLVQITTTHNEELDRDEVDSLHYDFRYRVVSEDRNKSSHWSEIIRYLMPDITDPFPYTDSTASRFRISKSGDVITATWSFPGDKEIAEQMALPPENPNYMSPEEASYIKFFRDSTQYDIYVRWNDNNTTDLSNAGWEDWEYETSVRSTSFDILKKDVDVKRIEIAIQYPTTIKIRDFYNNKLTLFRGLSGTI